MKIGNKVEILEVNMQDVVGEYVTPDNVPEWIWVNLNASFRHVNNNRDGIFEFMVNLSHYKIETMPPRLKAIALAAAADGYQFIWFHQGT